MDRHATRLSLACLATGAVIGFSMPVTVPAAIVICKPPVDGIETCRVILDPTKPVDEVET